MTAVEFFTAIAQLSGLLFVVTSMLAMGLSLTVPQIIQPLKNVRLVIMALLANFVLIPLLAYVILLVIPLEEGLRIGLILLATAAGAPFLPKLVQAAKGNIAFGVGLMVLLMVVTVIYMPLVLPWLLPGVQVDPGAIAQSLIVTMLMPLGIGLYVAAHAPESAADWAPTMNKVSGLAIMLFMVIALVLNVQNILGLLGTGGILALLLFIVASLALGFVFGGRDADIRSVMGLGTAQRNIAAAIVVGAQNFTDPNVLVMLMVGAILLLIVLMTTARRLGSRRETTAETATG